MNIYTQLPFGKHLGFFGIIWYLLQVIGLWKVFEKAHEPGWKALIPFYNFYILYKITNMPFLFWFQLLALGLSALFQALGYVFFLFSFLGWLFALACFILQAIMWFQLSRNFGHGAGFALGLIFLNPIFVMILGFGGSRYFYGFNQNFR